MDESDRFMVCIEVYDNKTDEPIIDEGFNTPSIIYAIEALEKAIEELNKL